MLQYRENISYYSSQGYNLEQQLAELRQLLHYEDEEEIQIIYQQIRKFIYREIKINELAVTRILNDLHQIRKSNRQIADVLEYFIANNTMSYKQIGEEFGCSKQNIDQIIKHYANQFIWLKNLVACKGAQDSKNENNRQIFFIRNGEKKKHTRQLSLWEEDIDI